MDRDSTHPRPGADLLVNDVPNKMIPCHPPKN